MKKEMTRKITVINGENKGEYMKNKKIYHIILICVVSILIIPAIINWLFKQSTSIDFFVAEWSAGDMLSFYGSLLAAILTVYGVYLTIQYSQHNYREDIHNRVLPFLALYSLRSRSNYQMFAPAEQERNQNKETFYEEYRLKEIYFIVENGNIDVKSSLSKDQQQTLIQGGFKYVATQTNSFSLCDVNLVNVPLEVENVGNGAAINLRIGLNKATNIKPVYITPINLKQNMTIYIHIFSENPTDNDLGEYNLEFYYNDIYKRKYAQKYIFSIKKDESKIFAELNFNSAQEIIC